MTSNSCDVIVKLMFSQKGFSGIVLIIILIVVAGVSYIGYLSFQKYNHYSALQREAIDKQKQYVEVAQQASALPLPMTAKSSYINLSTAWDGPLKIYNDPKLNISFTYPNDFTERVFTTEQIKSQTSYYAPKIKDYEDPSYSVWISSPSLSDEEYQKASEKDSNFYLTYSNNKMAIGIEQYENPKKLSLYDFIARQYSFYGGNGREMTFNDFKENLKPISLPFPGSYENLNSVSESPNRIVFFEAKGKIYQFWLVGGDGTGQGYSDAANDIFNNVLKTVETK